jgi:hypothetical protein
VEPVSPVAPVAPVSPVGPVEPVSPVAPEAPVLPVGPSIPSKFTLYTTLLPNVPLIFVIASTVNAPVFPSYVETRPSKLLEGVEELVMRTEFPVMYAKPDETVKFTLPPSTGVIVTADVVAVKNLSPGAPVAPVSPVLPVAPVSPVGPSIPSKFTLYIALLPYVP